MMYTYKRILVAVDGSKEADLAFKKAVEICNRNQSELVIAHIIDTRAYATMEAYDIRMTENAEKFAADMLANYQEMAKTSIETVETVIEYGSPKVRIAKDVAKERKVDLIICGATGLNAVERLFIGSVSEHIVRNAKCDVLVVRNEDN
ncbi:MULTISPECIES: universal stress protein [Bacillus]|uniref:universal stress protein n=1 Tax=Bacillus TaxID=1386 RepID=UPI001D0D5C19|nr:MULTISPECIES: universal stress protein [Bacillus]